MCMKCIELILVMTETFRECVYIIGYTSLGLMGTNWKDEDRYPGTEMKAQ